MPTVTGRATDYITFTRTSNATVTDSNGFIEWAGHNLLTNSESFDASAWSKGNVTASGNTSAAPNGTTTADTIAEDGALNFHYTVQSITTIASAQYTASVFMKAGTQNFGIINVYNNSTTSLYAAASFNLSTGAVVNSAASGTGYAIVGTPTITPVGSSGWYLCSVTFTNGTTGANFFSVALSNNGTIADYGMNTYTGTSKTILAWGAHLYRSDLGGMVLNPARGDAYYPTTPRNLIGYTEDFSVWNASAWQTDGILSFGSGSVSNAAIAPNGLQTADLITLTATNANHRIFANVPVVTSTKLLFACYAKANGYTKIGLREGGTAGAGAAFDLSGSGSVIGAYNVGGSTVGDMAITSVGNGWFRISCTIAFASASAMRFGIQILSPSYVAGTDLAATWTSDGTSGIYLWGAQLSDSASLDAYSPVYGAAVTSAAYYAPRLDFDPVTLAARGLLVEEQRTNLLTYSAQFDDAAWEKKGTATATGNTTASPDGATNADTIAGATSDVASSSTNSIERVPTVSSSTAYTFSLYVRSLGSTTCRIALRDASTGNVIFADLVPTTSWQRMTVTMTTGAATTQMNVRIGGTNGNIAIYGAQLEAGSFATSYIPTGASTATRTADVASVSTQAFPYSATEGTLVAKGTFIAPADAGVSVMANLDNGSSGESINIYRQSNLVYLNIFDNSGPAQAQWAVSGTTNLSTAAIAYKLNDIGAAVNGSSQTPDTSATLPTVDRMNIGRMWGGTFGANGWIRQITYLPRRISNSELQSRTA